MFRAVWCTFLVRWTAERKRREALYLALRVLCGWLCFGLSVLPVPEFRVVGGAWAAHPTRLRLLVGLCTMAEPSTVLRSLIWDAATLRVESPHGQSGRRVDRQSELRMVEYFGVANGFLRLTCCRVINLVLGVTRSSSRSPYNHAALLSADFEKHVLRLQAQL